MPASKKIHSFLEKSGQYLVILAIIFYGLIFSFFCLWKYYNFAYNALDLAIISQVFYNSSLGDFFASSIHPPAYLGDHFSPILFLLLPVYWLFKKPEALLVLQTLALGLSAWPLYLIAKKILGKSWAVLFAFFWLLNPFVQNINLYEFSFLPFAVFLIFWAFYFYQKQNFLAFLLFCFLVLLTREDTALVIFMLGPLAFLQKRKLRWWLWPMVLSALYFILAIKITAYFAPGGQYKFLIYYGWLGRDFKDILTHLVFQPWLLLTPLLKLGNWEFLLGLLLPLVFLPLLGPAYLLLGAGAFLQMIFRTSGASGALLQMSYVSLLLPAVFIAAVYGLKKIIGEKGIYLSSDRSRPVATRQLGFLILMAGVIYSCLTLGPLIGTFNKIYQNGFYRQPSAQKNELLKQIPTQAAVAAGYEFLAPLSGRKNLYSFNYAFLGKQQYLSQDYALPAETEYLLLDYDDLIGYQLQYGFNPFYQKQYQTAVQAWPKNLAGFGLIDIKDTAALYQKGAPDKFILVKTLCGSREPLFGSREPLLPTATGNPDCEELPAKETTELASDVSFAGFNRLDGEYQLFWQIDFPLKEIYRLKLTASDGQKIIYQKIYPFAWDLLAAQNLSGKKNIQTNYWFGLWPDDYELKIQLLKLGNGGLEIGPIRSTANIIDQEIPIGPEINLKLIADR